MGTHTETITATECAEVLYESPSSNYISDDIVTLYNGSGRSSICLMKFLPTMTKKRITSVSTKIFIIQNNGSYKIGFNGIGGSWNENTVTYNTMPPVTADNVYFTNQAVAVAGTWEILNVSATYPSNYINYAKNGITIRGGTGSSSVTFYSQRATSNNPQMTLTYEDVIPFTSNLFPLVSAPKHAINTFSWNFSYDTTNIIGILLQKSAKFRWRPYGQTPYTEIAVGTDQFVTLPANTFTTEFIEWQVVVTSDDNIEGAASGWIKVSTIDTVSTCQTISPKSMVIDGTKNNIFSWKHINTSLAPQSKFDLQYSTDNNVSWINLITQTTENQFYDVPANILPNGSILWRVRTYNTDNVVGSWSDTPTVIVRGAPPTPTITSCTSNPRPTISWVSTEQQGFKVKAGTYESNINYGTAKQFNVPVYLPDGVTTIQVAIQNIYGIWSKWAGITVTIINTVNQPITVTAISVNNAITLNWVTAEYKKYYIYRDNILIAKSTSNTYIDFFSNGTHTYQIRGISDNDNYTLSNSVKATVICKYDVLSSVDNINWISLKYKKGGLLTRTFSKTSNITYLNFAGRTKPVIAKDGYTFRKANYNFNFINREYVDELNALVGEIVIGKDNRGNVIIGVLNDYDIESGRYFDVTYTITEIDYDEEIEYDS